MWRFGYDTNASFILTLALLSMLGTILVWQKYRTGKTICIWFWAAFFGVLVGFSGTFAMLRFTGLDLQVLAPPGASAEDGASAPGGESTGLGGGMGGGGGGGMGRGPRPKRDLIDVVRKVALLTGEVGIRLSPEQASALTTALKDVEKAPTMSDDEAKAKYDQLLTLLDDNQKEQLEAIGLPRSPRIGGGGGGSEPPSEDANPFAQEPNSAALETLRQRFSGEKKSEE